MPQVCEGCTAKTKLKLLAKRGAFLVEWSVSGGKGNGTDGRTDAADGQLAAGSWLAVSSWLAAGGWPTADDLGNGPQKTDVKLACATTP